MLKNKNIIITGGAGFIGKSLIIKLLQETETTIFNLDKLNYSSDLEGINQLFNKKNYQEIKRYKFFQIDLKQKKDLKNLILKIKPDLVFHLAAETHVDRSIDEPNIFFESNVMGTLNLLEACRNYWNSLSKVKKENFRFVHISTDEVFGTLPNIGYFDENSKYAPRSPYAASKASSDQLVRAWNYTYGFPTIITNCSNNFGPWQFPEKFIPLIINKALSKESIPIYGDGKNIRDWLFVDDHIDALILVGEKGLIGETYCIGGSGEETNLNIAKEVCNILDITKPIDFKYSKLLTFVEDRPGHDYRYAIDSNKLKEELNWKPKYNIKSGLKKTVEWYVQNLSWCQNVMQRSGYKGQRLGSNL